jgi:hypothetical protein
MSALDKPALQALIAPRSVDEFYTKYWPDKPGYFVSHGDPARLPAFLRSQELSSFDALAHANQGKVAFTNGAKSSYMMPADTASGEYLFKMGLTVFFADITPDIPGAADFVRQLEADLGINPGATLVTAWASPAKSGAAAHYDADDIISIQLQGVKRFELAPVRGLAEPYARQYTPGTPFADDLYPQMTAGFPDWREAEFEAVEMRPGSVLCFRRGMWHRTYASGDSLAVTLVIRPPAAADFILQQLRLVLLQHPQWRRPLYGAWGSGDERDAALAQAVRLIKEIPNAAAAISVRDLVLPTLPEAQRLTLIDQDSRFQRVPGTGVDYDEPKGPRGGELQWVRITIKDEHGTVRTRSSIEIPPPCLDMMDWLGKQSVPFAARALQSKFPAVPPDEQLRLLETCTRGGLLKLLWYSGSDSTEER